MNLLCLSSLFIKLTIRDFLLFMVILLYFLYTFFYVFQVIFVNHFNLSFNYHFFIFLLIQEDHHHHIFFLFINFIYEHHYIFITQMLMTEFKIFLFLIILSDIFFVIDKELSLLYLDLFSL